MYENILVPTDGSEGANMAAEHALGIAGTYGATVHVLYVVDVRMSPISTDMDREEVVQLLEQSGGTPTTPVLQRAEGTDVPATEAIRLGVPHETIHEYVDEEDINLVVMGTHGRTGLERTLLGSTTERVVRTVDTPVMTVPLSGD
ncbi:universal stress protein [Halococcus thailandensis]|uniref:UspA domain-containing protein n=1 Tax=Halococcus thailandensis JCM 13552 TaxID=1227457 RepID=M0NDS4_9EURY|nr:universal stress protein [Halococcus thailandensis]EMA56122.1 UspA domain-containing protein [Halococcus thailandensis JCM 13552]